MGKPSTNEEDKELLSTEESDEEILDEEEAETSEDEEDEDSTDVDGDGDAQEGGGAEEEEPSRKTADAGQKSSDKRQKSSQAETPPIRVIRKQLKAEQVRRKELESYIDALAALGGVDRNTLLQQIKAIMQAGTHQPNRQRAQVRQDSQLSVVARQSQQALLELEAEKLSRKPFYQDLADDTIREAVIDYALANNVNVKTAYLLLYGEDAVEKYAETTVQAKAAERETKKSLHAERDTAGRSPSREELDELEIARRAGLDPGTFRAWDFDSYRKYLAKKRKKRR